MAAMYSGVASCSFMISVTSSRSQSGASKSELLGICVSCEFGMIVVVCVCVDACAHTHTHTHAFVFVCACALVLVRACLPRLSPSDHLPACPTVREVACMWRCRINYYYEQY